MILKKIRKSFKYAWLGFKFFLAERNIKIHLMSTFLVLSLGFLFRITGIEWVAVVFAVSLVLSFEIMNTVIENIFDLIYPHNHQKIAIIKDLSAAAVFVSAVGSIAIGLIIFIPYFLKLLQ